MNKPTTAPVLPGSSAGSSEASTLAPVDESQDKLQHGLRTPVEAALDSELHKLLLEFEADYRQHKLRHSFGGKTPCYPLDGTRVSILSSLIFGSSPEARGTAMFRLLALPVCQSLGDSDASGESFGVQGSRLWDRLDLSGAVIGTGGELKVGVFGRFASPVRLSESSIASIAFNALEAPRAQFARSRLKNVIFWDSLLGGSDFDEAILESTNFVGCDLRRSTFRGAVLHSVTFDGSILCGVDFTEAKGLSASTLKHAIVDSSTLLPSGLEAAQLLIEKKCEDHSLFASVLTDLHIQLVLLRGGPLTP